MITVAALWRHPIKSHGREALEAVTLTEGQTMPWDRHWAVTHAATKFDHAAPAWASSRSFVIGTLSPALAGLWAKLDEATARISLSHAQLGTHSFAPDDPAETAGFLAWIAPLTAGQDIAADAIVTLGQRGMTDTAYASVSLMNMASHKAVADRLGQALEPERWRGNIWLDGPAAWEETEWLGRDLRIGGAVLRVREQVKRCKHTMANPVTGLRDIDTLGVLNDAFGHQHFGLYTEVIATGRVALGDPCEVV